MCICDIVYTDAIRLGRTEEPHQPAEARHWIRHGNFVFLDPLHLTVQDRVVEGEERWQTIGMVGGVLLLLVAHTIVDEGEEVIRIISARKANRQERTFYEEA